MYINIYNLDSIVRAKQEKPMTAKINSYICQLLKEKTPNENRNMLSELAVEGAKTGREGSLSVS